MGDNYGDEIVNDIRLEMYWVKDKCMEGRLSTKRRDLMNKLLIQMGHHFAMRGRSKKPDEAKHQIGILYICLMYLCLLALTISRRRNDQTSANQCSEKAESAYRSAELYGVGVYVPELARCAKVSIERLRANKAKEARGE